MTIDQDCILIRFAEAHNNLTVTNAERINIKDDEIEINVVVGGVFRKFCVDRSKVVYYEVWNG